MTVSKDRFKRATDDPEALNWAQRNLSKLTTLFSNPFLRDFISLPGLWPKHKCRTRTPTPNLGAPRPVQPTKANWLLRPQAQRLTGAASSLSNKVPVAGVK